MLRVLALALGLSRVEAMIGTVAAVHAHRRERQNSRPARHLKVAEAYDLLYREPHIDPEAELLALERQEEKEKNDKEKVRRKAMKKKTDAVIKEGVKREKWKGRQEKLTQLFRCGGKGQKDSDDEQVDIRAEAGEEVDNTGEMEPTRSAVFDPKEPMDGVHDPVKAYVEEGKPVRRVRSSILLMEEKKKEPEIPRVAVTTVTNMRGETVQRIPTPYPGKGHQQQLRQYPSAYSVVYPAQPQHTLSSASTASAAGGISPVGAPVESKRLVTFHTATKLNDGGSFVRVPTAYSVGDLVGAAPVGVSFHSSVKTADGGDFHRIPTAYVQGQQPSGQQPSGQQVSGFDRVPSDGIPSVTSSLRSH